MLSRTSSRVSSPVALVIRYSAATTAAAGWPPASLWSSSQAAKPTGESAMPYKVCARRHHLGVLDLVVCSLQLFVGASFLSWQTSCRRVARLGSLVDVS